MDDDMRDSDSASDSDDQLGAPQSASTLQHQDSFADAPHTNDNRPSPASTGNGASPRNNQSQHGQLSSHGLNPRSCVTCRKRKVKCDKSHPCSNCRRAGIECVFPKPGRAPRRNKKAPDHELLARLRRLEGVVQKMGKSVDIDGVETDMHAQPVRTPSLTYSGGSSIATDVNHGAFLAPEPSLRGYDASQEPEFSADPRAGHEFTKLKNEMGRLVVEQGKSRYVSNKFWAQLTSELAEMQELLEDRSSDDEADNGTSPGSGSHNSNKEKHAHQEFIFGYSSLMTTLRILHPHPRQIMTYWSLYKQNIDPVLRLLHKPTTEEMFIKAANDLDHLPRSTECIMFAIYLTVVTSMSQDECRQHLELDKDVALARYRYATEQALAKAGLVETQELKVLQATMLFLAAVRRIDASSFSWAMTGLMLRISQRQGLHRDGGNFALSPFDTEERRRLWWQMATFDGRVSDDQGIDPMVFQMTFDTKIPLNINDEDIWPGMKDPPVERERPTDMVFDLTRYEIGSTIRLLKTGMRNGCSVDYRDQLIDKLRERLETKYLRYCDMSVPLEWVTVNICRLVLAKIWLMAHYPLNFRNGHATATEELRHRTFVKSVDIIRYTRLLETQQKTLKWGWMFRTYSQWHAAAFAFDELRRRTLGQESEEAWRVMDEAFKEWENPSSGYTKSILWKPICRLRQLAKEARRKELERLNMFPQDGSIGRGSSITSPSLRAPLDRAAPDSWMGKGANLPQVTTNDGVFIDHGMMGHAASIDNKPLNQQQPMHGIQNIDMGAGMGLMAMGDATGESTAMGDADFISAYGWTVSGTAESGDGSRVRGGNGAVNGATPASVPDPVDSSWLDPGFGEVDGMANMTWDDNLLDEMVAAQPIDVNMSAMWGDPVQGQ